MKPGSRRPFCECGQKNCRERLPVEARQVSGAASPAYAVVRKHVLGRHRIVRDHGGWLTVVPLQAVEELAA